MALPWPYFGLRGMRYHPGNFRMFLYGHLFVSRMGFAEIVKSPFFPFQIAIFAAALDYPFNLEAACLHQLWTCGGHQKSRHIYQLYIRGWFRARQNMQ